jgi:hypothetical protein
MKANLEFPFQNFMIRDENGFGGPFAEKGMQIASTTAFGRVPAGELRGSFFCFNLSALTSRTQSTLISRSFLCN